MPDFKQILQAYVVVDENDVVMAFASFVVQAEVVMMPNRNKKDIAASLKLLLDEAHKGAKELGIPQIHAFTWNESFAEILKKHFGFRTCKGEALFRDEH